MQKIPTIWLRDFAGDPSQLTSEPHPDCMWVFRGEGTPTQKHDGTCCKIDAEGAFWKRYTRRRDKALPAGFRVADYDKRTGKMFGWVPVDPDDPADQYHVNARLIVPLGSSPEGTYELCGPKIQGNPEGCVEHVLIKHGSVILDDLPDKITHASMQTYFETHDMEGIVWHHEDGRMAKLKGRDLGVRRSPIRPGKITDADRAWARGVLDEREQKED